MAPATSPAAPLRASAGRVSAGDPAPAGLRWRVLDTGSGPGPWNMALGHAQAGERDEGAAVLRLYRWTRPTVSLGRNEPARDRYRLDVAEARGVEFVRRPTGGRAVLHHRELTYAVVLPLRALEGPRRAYRRINRGLLRGLASLGAPVALAGEDTPTLRPSDGPCFRAPASGEVIAGGRKLVGSAQARLGGSLLQHGSLLLADDQRLLQGLRREDTEDVPPPATLDGALGRIPEWGALLDALAGGLEKELGGRWDVGSLSRREEAAATALLDRYESPEWTWRR